MHGAVPLISHRHTGSEANPSWLWVRSRLQCYRRDERFTLSLTPVGNFVPVCMSWALGGNQGTQRKPTEVQGEHTKSAKYLNPEPSYCWANAKHYTTVLKELFTLTSGLIIKGLNLHPGFCKADLYQCALLKQTRITRAVLDRNASVYINFFFSYKQLSRG